MTTPYYYPTPDKIQGSPNFPADQDQAYGASRQVAQAVAMALGQGTGLTPDQAMDKIRAVLAGTPGGLGVPSLTWPPYNADPTGVTDSTPAFLAASAEAETNGGAVFRLPRGTYKAAAAQIPAATGLKIIGDGYMSTQINAQGAGAYFMNMDPPGYTIASGRVVEDLLLTGIHFNVTGMDLFWGANLIRSRIAGNQLDQNSPGNCVFRIAQSTGTNGATYLAENFFGNKETMGASRTVEAWSLDFTGTGKRGNDNWWEGYNSKIWPGTGAFWMRLQGDNGQLGSKRNIIRNLVFELSGGCGGLIWLQNTSDWTIENITSEDLGSNPLINPLILLNAGTGGPNVSSVRIRDYSRRSGTAIGAGTEDIRLGSACDTITIDSPSQTSGGSPLTVNFGGATNCVRLGAWPTTTVLTGATGVTSYV